MSMAQKRPLHIPEGRIKYHPLPCARRIVPSAAGTRRYGYSVSFDCRRAKLMWRGHRRAGATTSHRLYKSRSRPRNGMGDYMIAPIASSSSTTQPESATTAPHSAATRQPPPPPPPPGHPCLSAATGKIQALLWPGIRISTGQSTIVRQQAPLGAPRCVSWGDKRITYKQVADGPTTTPDTTTNPWVGRTIFDEILKSTSMM